MHRTRTPLRRRRDRGVSLSAFVMTVVVALLMMGGLVIDGGAQSNASRECQQVAAEAARAGQDAAALNRAAGVGTVDTHAIRAAALQVLADHPEVSHDVQIDGDTVVVRTSRSVPTTFLSLARIDSLDASGEARAVLRHAGG